MLNLRDKTAVITGATSGIGFELSLQLIKEGAKVLLIGRNFNKLKKTLSGLKINNSKVFLLSANFTDFSELENLIRKLKLEVNIDILIHCAGSISLGSFENDTIENLNIQYKVNVAAPFYITQKLLPNIKNTKGQIIFLNSTAGLEAMENSSLYASSKHAMKAMAKSLRKELLEDKVKVTSIFLGSTDTPMQEKVQEIRKNVYDPNKFMSAKDVANTIVSILKIPKDITITDITLMKCK